LLKNDTYKSSIDFLNPSIEGFRFALREALSTTGGQAFFEISGERLKGILKKMSNCHTVELGFAIGECQSCGEEEFLGFLGCHDKNCPTCSGNKRFQSAIKLCESVFNVPYFSYVFTLPHELNEIFDDKREDLYREILGIFMNCVSETLLFYGQNEERDGEVLGELDVITFLHTWDQELKKHIHVHALVSSCGYSIKKNKLNHVKKSPNDKMFLFSNKKISISFRDSLLKKIRKAIEKSKEDLPFKEKCFLILEELEEKNFNVFAEEPIAGSEYAIIYLMQYVNRVGISPFRIRKIEDGLVYLRRKRPPKDYIGNKEEYDFDDLENCFCMKLEEFLSRFCSHILPKNFKTMRRYGLYSTYMKRKKSDNPMNIEEKYLPKILSEEEKLKIRDIMMKNEVGKKIESHQEQTYKTNFGVTICKKCDSKCFKFHSFDRNGNYTGKEDISAEMVLKAKLFVNMQRKISKEKIVYKSIEPLIVLIRRNKTD